MGLRPGATRLGLRSTALRRRNAEHAGGVRGSNIRRAAGRSQPLYSAGERRCSGRPRRVDARPAMKRAAVLPRRTPATAEGSGGSDGPGRHGRPRLRARGALRFHRPCGGQRQDGGGPPIRRQGRASQCRLLGFVSRSENDRPRSAGRKAAIPWAGGLCRPPFSVGTLPARPASRPPIREWRLAGRAATGAMSAGCGQRPIPRRRAEERQT